MKELIRELYDAQYELEHWLINQKKTKLKNLSEKVFSLQLNISRFAQSWKFESNPRIQIEMFAYSLGFLLSVGLEIDHGVIRREFRRELSPSKSEQQEEIQTRIMRIFDLVSSMYFHLQRSQRELSLGHYDDIISEYFGIADALGYTKDDIKEAYFRCHEKKFSF